MDDQTQQAQFVPQDDQVGTPVAPTQPTEQMPDQSVPYDEEIKSDKIETKRKTFFLDLKANSMGRYIKISERSSGKRSTIIIPEENIQEFVDKLHGLFSDPISDPRSNR